MAIFFFNVYFFIFFTNLVFFNILWGTGEENTVYVQETSHIRTVQYGHKIFEYSSNIMTKNLNIVIFLFSFSLIILGLK